VAYQTPTELIFDARPHGYLWNYVEGTYDAGTGLYTVDIGWLVSQGMTYVLAERATAAPARRVVRAATAPCTALHPHIVCSTTPSRCGVDASGVDTLSEDFIEAFQSYTQQNFLPPVLDVTSCGYSVFVADATDPSCHPVDAHGNPLGELEGFYSPSSFGQIFICQPVVAYTPAKLRALAAHELFHAFQAAYFPPPAKNGTVIKGPDLWVGEGMAEAAVNSAVVMQRDPEDDPHDTLRSVDSPLTSSTSPDIYFAQDFWVHLFTATTPDPATGRSVRRAYPLGDFAELLAAGGTTHDLDNFMQTSPKYRLLGLEYWAWAKNQAYEKTDVTFGGRLTNPCTLEAPPLVAAPAVIDYPTKDCANVTFTGPLQTKAVVIHVNADRKNLPVTANNTVSFKVYQNGATDCVSVMDGTRTFKNITAGTDLTVLVSNLSTATSAFPLSQVIVGNDPLCKKN
jgi:hypothetical protein